MWPLGAKKRKSGEGLTSLAEETDALFRLAKKNQDSKDWSLLGVLLHRYSVVCRKLQDYVDEYPWLTDMPRFTDAGMESLIPAKYVEIITALEPVVKRMKEASLLEKAPMNSTANRAPPSLRTRGEGRVFVVHGHDNEAKQSVARFIERLGLEAVILHEQPDVGQTVIEKFEEYADVEYAIVLLSPDDIGAAKSDLTGAKPRARQNVVFELGFFAGRLGRGKVCILCRDRVEIPSDYHGVIYAEYDASGGWRSKLVKEMLASGVKISPARISEAL